MTTHGPNTDDPIVRYTRHAAGGYDKLPPGCAEQRGRRHRRQRRLVGAPLFDAWGNAVPGAPLGRIERYGYTGREPDASGLIYYRARYYDPTLARFTQRDPSGLAGGLKPYAYVGNDPVNYIDPSGRDRASPVSTSNETAYGGGCLSANGYGDEDSLTDVAKRDEYNFAEGPVELAGGLCDRIAGWLSDLGRSATIPSSMPAAYTYGVPPACSSGSTFNPQVAYEQGVCKYQCHGIVATPGKYNADHDEAAGLLNQAAGNLAMAGGVASTSGLARASGANGIELVATATELRKWTESGSVASVMNDLARLLPDNTWAMELIVDAGTVRLIGLSSDPPAAAKALASSKLLANIRLSSVGSPMPDRGVSQFEVTAELVKTP